jgi:glycine betaine/proline transport system ATP-binding protein
MVFQAFGLLPWRTVRENVGFGLELSGMPAAGRARVDRQLSLVGLSDWAERKVASCRAACSSAWASPAPLPPTRRSC